MASSILTMNITGQIGLHPRLGRYVTDDTLSQIIEPGYFNRVGTQGNTLENTDFIFVAYSGGKGMFGVSIVEGVITLVATDSSSFAFPDMQFVAQNGNDLNDGLTYNTPKATIQAAIDHFDPMSGTIKCVQVLDSGQYTEALAVQQSMVIYAPTAFLESPSGEDSFTLQDLGGQYLSIVEFNFVNNNGGNLVNVQGLNSSLFLAINSVAIGNIYLNGSLILSAKALVGSTITLDVDGQFRPACDAGVGVTFVGRDSENVQGYIGNEFYGAVNLHDTVIGAPLQVEAELAGRAFTAEDGNKIVRADPLGDLLTYTCPLDLSIPIGTQIEVVLDGAGNIFFDTSGGALIVTKDGGLVGLLTQYGSAIIEKWADDLWFIKGDITIQP